MIIDDGTPDDELFPAEFGRGLVPRDYTLYPAEMFAPPADMPLIPRSEWDARIAEQEATQSSLEHIRLRGFAGKPIPSLNQTTFGYCWSHSITHTLMLVRALNNQPYVPLSAFAIAATIKNGKNEGGWCGLSAQFARDRGIPSQAYWPQGSADLKHGGKECWDNAALHKITADWVDLTRPVWGQNLTFDQVASCLLMNIPCALDYNWWAHSICGIRLVRVEAGSYGIKIWNSWSDSWQDRGMGTLTGQRAIPDGAVATREVTAAPPLAV